MKFMSILLNEGRKEDLKKKYANKFKETDLDWILNISDLVDFNQKYSDFVLKNVDPNSQTFDEDVKTAVKIVKDFHKYQPNLEKKDINQYNNLRDLDLVLEPIKAKEKERDLEKQVDRIYEDDKFLVIRPKTHQASCKYGANTKWCTTSQSDSDFKSYTSGNQGLYYIINKSKPTNQKYSKVAIHFDEFGFPKYYDSKDSEMKEKQIKIFENDFPEINAAVYDYHIRIFKPVMNDLLKKIFNYSGSEQVGENLGRNIDLTVEVEGFKTIDSLGPGHAKGRCFIELNYKLTDQYDIFITFRPTFQKSYESFKDDRTFEIDFKFKRTDYFIDKNDFINLGLETEIFSEEFTTWGYSVTSSTVREDIAWKIAYFIRDNPESQKKILRHKKFKSIYI